jgi:hypothetical protein
VLADVSRDQPSVRVEASAGGQADDDPDGLAVVEGRPLSVDRAGQRKDDDEECDQDAQNYPF